MPLFKTFQSNDYRGGIWKTDESLEELNALLPDPVMYREDLLNLKTPSRRLERLAVRVLLYELLGNQKLVLYEDSGAPYLQDKSFTISISHTAGYVAAIVGKSAIIGIDIERFGEKVHKVSKKFMREDEIASFYKQVDTWSLLLHWSAKETLFKALGCEGVDFREHLFISPFQVRESGEFIAQEFRTTLNRKFTINYIINQDFVLTWTYL